MHPLLVTLLSLALCGLQALANPCGQNGSGMCSVGQVKLFYGSVTNSSGFKAALEAVSFKRELILVTTKGSFHLEFFFQLHAQLMKFGLAHFLALSTEESGCQDVVRVGRWAESNISCAWDAFPMHHRGFGGGPHLWHLRWRFIARASRMSYNILSLDSDYSVFQDPYLFLKKPPFDSVQLLGVEESAGMNGGFSYTQNMRPDGPTAYVFHRTTEVPLRWMDDDMAHISKYGKMRPNDRMCVTFDQCLLQDGLESAIVGRPITRCVLHNCLPDGWKANLGTPPQVVTKQGVADLQWSIVSSINKKTNIKIHPASWPKVNNLPEDDKCQMRRVRMTVPNYNGTIDPPPEFGGPIYSRIGGNYTRLYFEQLRGDCPTCPWWKDEKPEDAAAAASINETFAYAPSWLVDSASNIHYGYINPPDGSAPRQVLLHYHVMIPKAFASKVYGTFDWQLSKRMHASPQADSALAPGPYITGAAPEHVLVLPPTLVGLSRTRNVMEYKRVIAGLVQLALISNRTLVFPDLPCYTMWAHRDNDTTRCNGRHRIHRLYPDHFPYASLPDPANPKIKAKVYAFASINNAVKGCMGPARWMSGMMAFEFENWIANDAPERARKGPGPSNTLFFPTVANPYAKQYIADELPVLDVDEVASELSKFDGEPLLYVGRPVLLDMEAGRGKLDYNNWRPRFKRTLLECRGLFLSPASPDSQDLVPATDKDYIVGPVTPLKSLGW